MLSITIVLTLLVGDEYEFIPKVRRVTHHIGEYVCTGIIDPDGFFLPDASSLQRAIASKIKKVEVIYAESMPNPLLKNVKHGQKFYEYRYGLLVPVTVDIFNRIIPEKNEKIIEFSAYIYHANARIIYNLPGVFLPKSK
jgi:hypothetical protein